MNNTASISGAEIYVHYSSVVTFEQNSVATFSNNNVTSDSVDGAAYVV